jgi:transcriptional antiterminator RfaH
MINLATGQRWYVVQTRPHAEARAAQNLKRQGFGTYLPRYCKRRRHARRVENVTAPLFPRYLFVAADLATQRWRAIHSTFGVSQLVCHGEAPVPVTESILQELWRRQDEAGYVRLDSAPRFSPGDKVRVSDGVFSSCLGLFEGMTDSQRVAILLDLLGRKVKVVLDAELVEAA